MLALAPELNVVVAIEYVRQLGPPPSLSHLLASHLRTRCLWPVISVWSEGIILSVRLREPALELCPISNIGDYENVSLEMACILSPITPTVAASAQALAQVKIPDR